MAFRFILFFIGSLVSLYFLNGFISHTKTSVPIVDAPVGKIGGTLLTSKYKRNIFAYQAIPYAKAPVGNLRFKPTVALPDGSWSGVFDGSGGVTKCVQLSEIPTLIPVSGKEDCLQLNVYVPDTAKDQPLPVMVWFHGGGFTSGDSSSRLYGPGYLLDKDVILVTVNYRLGIFGFLTLGVNDLAGNQGMWDQLESLKWVQRNIGAFGGDKDKVTIFGESAGGFSISYHLTSHQSQNYFHSAIVQSGPLESGYKYKGKTRSLTDVHKEFAMKMGCPFNQDNIQATIACLQDKPVQDLMKGLKMFDQCNTLATGMMAFPVIWTPTPDHSYSENPFFKMDPVDVMSKGLFNKVPTMIGSLRDEGLLHTATMMQNPVLFEHFKKHWNECAANSFLGLFWLNELDNDHLSKIQAIKDFYLDGQDLWMNHWTMQNLSYAFGDHKFLVGSDKMASQLSKHVKTYFYQFDHLGSFSIADIFSSTKPKLALSLLKKMLGFHETKSLGVCHADDLLYLFKTSLPLTILPDSTDQKMVDKMVELWTNFARHHDPTPESKEWLPCCDQKNRYVILKNAQIIAQTDPKRDQRIEFWKNLAK